MFARSTELVGALHRAGVKLLAGTDARNPFCFPGFSLHDELELLVNAGLSPMEALQTATRNAAQYLGMMNDLGTVERGKLADLVLLKRDPIKSIKNTRSIAAVVVQGQLLTMTRLRAMLDAVAESAKTD